MTLRPLATSCAKDYKVHSLVQISFTEPPNTCKPGLCLTADIRTSYQQQQQQKLVTTMYVSLKTETRWREEPIGKPSDVSFIIITGWREEPPPPSPPTHTHKKKTLRTQASSELRSCVKVEVAVQGSRP